jgi:uncharacterized membrane protein YedE/YeeE
MTLDWPHFTPALSLAGGVLIGGAAGLLILLSGRILGVSGIVGGLLDAGAASAPRRWPDIGWRLTFVLGMLAAPASLALWAPGWIPAARFDAGYGTIIVAGLLVGFGTRYGSGCTSGHGVCGISRLSPRSMVATLTFMAAGFITVLLLRHS